MQRFGRFRSKFACPAEKSTPYENEIPRILFVNQFKQRAYFRGMVRTDTVFNSLSSRFSRSRFVVSVLALFSPIQSLVSSSLNLVTKFSEKIPTFE
jgi:hypothetical protein